MTTGRTTDGRTYIGDLVNRMSIYSFILNWFERLSESYLSIMFVHLLNRSAHPAGSIQRLFERERSRIAAFVAVALGAWELLLLLQ